MLLLQRFFNINFLQAARSKDPECQEEEGHGQVRITVSKCISTYFLHPGS